MSDEILVIETNVLVSSLGSVLTKVNDAYPLRTLIDSLLTMAESSIRTKQDIKNVIDNDIPHIIFNVTVGDEIDNAAVNNFITAIIQSLPEVYQVTKKIMKSFSSSFYVLDIIGDKIMIKGK